MIQNTDSKIRIAYFITNLNIGGAEKMLLSLILRLDKKDFSPRVFCLRDGGLLIEDFHKNKIPVSILNINNWKDVWGAIQLVKTELHCWKPNIIQSSLYHADFFCSLLKSFQKNTPLIWTLHNQKLPQNITQKTTIFLQNILIPLSYFMPQKIVSVAESVKLYHKKIGFSTNKNITIYNGVDTNYFIPDNRMRINVRKELGLDLQAKIILHPARFDPVKDPSTLFEAFSIYLKKNEKTYLVCCGPGFDWENHEIQKLLDGLDIQKKFIILLGYQADMKKLYAAADLCTLSSISEAFPLSLLEAMSCGIPCVAPNVGDIPMIIDQWGKIVPVRDPNSLANAWKSILCSTREKYIELSNGSRKRVIENFSFEEMIKSYTNLYYKII